MGELCKTKICKTCGERKDRSEFHMIRRYLRGVCKVCANKVRRKYKIDNKEKIIEASRVYRIRNREWINTKKAAHYLSHKSEILKKRRASRMRYIPELMMTRGRAYYLKHRDKLRHRASLWFKKNKDKAGERKRGRALEMTDSYVKELIVRRTALSGLDIPQKLVELKRAQVTLKRLIKKGSGK